MTNPPPGSPDSEGWQLRHASVESRQATCEKGEKGGQKIKKKWWFYGGLWRFYDDIIVFLWWFYGGRVFLMVLPGDLPKKKDFTNKTAGRMMIWEFLKSWGIPKTIQNNGLQD